MTPAARREGRILGALVAAAVFATLGAPSASAQSDHCANAQYRTGPSANLPDCRAYEMVSPADKDAYTLVQTRTSGNPTYASVDGDRALFGTITPFANPAAGNPGTYLSRRTPDGWVTRNATPAFCGPDPSGLGDNMTLQSLSQDFSRAIWGDPANGNCDPADHAGGDIYLAGEDGALTWLSHNGSPKTVDASASLRAATPDLAYVVFTSGEKLALPFGEGRIVGPGLYVRHDGELAPVDVAPGGGEVSPCGADIAGEADVGGRISDDGRVILFQATRNGSVPACLDSVSGGQIYARIDGEKTVHLSKSRLAVPEARVPATFMGASSDGGTVYFSSAERLTDDATAGGGLYRYDLSLVLAGAADEGELAFLSPSLDAAPAGIRGRTLAGHSSDFSVVYFIASGVLAEGAPASGSKLYMLRDGELSYVAPWLGSLFTPAGDMMVSSNGTKAAILAKPPGSPQRLDLFDADSHTIVCASCPDGPSVGDVRLQGRDSAERPPQYGPERFVTDDGRVFFTSLDQLVAADSNSMYDVYEYDDGEHKLLSTGTSVVDAFLWGVGPGGASVFLTTDMALVAEDVDNGDTDLYVARVGGGFPPPAGGVAPCAGDGCQSGSPAGPVGGSPGSADLRGAGNATAARIARVSLLRGRMAVRGRAGALRLRVSGAGRVVVRGRGIVRVSRRVGRAGPHRVRVRLSKAGRRALARRGRLAVAVRVRFRTGAGEVRQARGRIVFRVGGGRAGGR